MPNTQVRVVGGGYSTFNYKGRPIAFLESVRDSGQKPYSTPYETIYSIGDRRPREIVTQSILAEGTLTLAIRELWNEPVWWQLADLAGTDTITDVWRVLNNEPAYVTCSKIITPPTSVGPPRIINYQNCLIVGIDDGDTIDVAGLCVARTITVVYTHKTRG